jgi:hypothetical protein
MEMPLRIARPMANIARVCLVILLGLWVIELAYSLQNYVSGGWPAVWGYLQGITQGHRDIFAPVPWTKVVLRHIVLAALTWAAAWVVRGSRRGPALRK